MATAHPGVTWLTKNARRLGPRERSEQGPRRRAFLVGQVTPDLAVFICAPLPYIHVWAKSTAKSRQVLHN
ncbi:hypothetical protein TYRP_020102 [Tyrophagus putrescentiae]|nr:hypothetical protein TYRP_020102 [Tyrophagus putrescentiae]